MEKWIKKMWYICTIEYYSVIKDKDIMKFSGKWVKLEKSQSSVRYPRAKRTCMVCLIDKWILAIKFITITDSSKIFKAGPEKDA